MAAFVRGFVLRVGLFGLLVVAAIALLLPVGYGLAWVGYSAPQGLADSLSTSALLVGGLVVRFLVAAAIVVALIAALLPVVYGAEGARRLALRAAGFEQVAGLMWRRGTYYAPAHAWLRRRAELMRIGLDAVASRVLRRVDEVLLPPEGTLVAAGAPLFVVARGHRRFEFPSPIAGTVRRVNRRLGDEPEAVVRDPYRRGWLLELEPTGDQAGLLRDEDARKWFASESTRLANAIEHATGVHAADGGELIVPAHFAITDEQFCELAREFLHARTAA